MFKYFRPHPSLVTSPEVFPAHDGVHMNLSLVFSSAAEAKAFLEANRLPTVVFDRK